MVCFHCLREMQLSPLCGWINTRSRPSGTVDQIQSGGRWDAKIYCPFQGEKVLRPRDDRLARSRTGLRSGGTCNRRHENTTHCNQHSSRQWTDTAGTLMSRGAGVYVPYHIVAPADGEIMGYGNPPALARFSKSW